MIAYAQNPEAFALGFLARFNEAILFPLITLLSVIALIIFLWGAFEFVKGAADSTAREQGKKHILWGLIGLLVMLSAYGILSIAAATFGLEAPAESTAPGIEAPRTSPIPVSRPDPMVGSEGSGNGIAPTPRGGGSER